MKRLLFAAALLVSMGAQAQNLKPTVYKPTPLVTKVGNYNMNMNIEVMGQSMEILNEGTTTTQYVISYNGVGGTADMKVVRVQSKGSAMGQEMEYDSDKPGTGGPAEEMMGKMVGKVTKIGFNKFGQITTITKPTGEEGGPGMMNGMEMVNQIAEGKLLEFLAPTGGRERKPGDVWMDSVVLEGVRMINTYTYQGTANNESLIETKGTVEMDKTLQQNGMDMLMKMAGTSQGTISVNPAAGTILKRSQKLDFKGTMDMMGNSTPITMTLTSNDLFTF